MKRSFFSLFCLCWGALTAYSQSATWNKSFQDYFDTYDDVAVEQMKLYGIPASITLAQGVLESGAGRSELARKSNNHFGIKCNNGWSGRRSYHDDDAQVNHERLPRLWTSERKGDDLPCWLAQRH